MLDSFEELTGGRVYHMYMVYGGVRRDLTDGFEGRLETTLQTIEERLPAIDKLMFESAVWRARTIGVGVVQEEEALELGLSGPTLRDAGHDGLPGLPGAHRDLP